MNEARRKNLIDRMLSLADRLEALVAGLTPEQLGAHPLEGEWSVAQNIHHLADTHMVSFARCKLMLTEDNPDLSAYDPERYAETPDARSTDVAASLALIRALHQRWAAFWESLDETGWGRRGQHPEEGEITLETVLRLYSMHGEAHIDQITRTIAAGQDVQIPSN